MRRRGRSSVRSTGLRLLLRPGRSTVQWLPIRTQRWEAWELACERPAPNAQRPEPLSFNKGACNIGNRFSYRVWFHNNLPERSTQIYASEKYGHYNGNIYKGGIRSDIYVSKSGTYYPQRVI